MLLWLAGAVVVQKIHTEESTTALCVVAPSADILAAK